VHKKKERRGQSNSVTEKGKQRTYFSNYAQQALVAIDFFLSLFVHRKKSTATSAKR